MLGRIHLSGEDLYIEYGMEDVGDSSGVFYRLGTGITGFLEQSIEKIDRLFKEFIIFNISCPERFELNYTDYEHSLSEFIGDIDSSCPYLHFHVQAFLRYMLDYFADSEGSFQALMYFATDAFPNKKQRNDMEYTYEILIDSYREDYAKNLFNIMAKQRQSKLISTNPAGIPDSTFYAYIAAKNILLQDISNKKKRILKELDFITSERHGMKQIKPNQRLYFLDYQRIKKGDMPYYVHSRLKSEFMPHPPVPKNLKSFDEVKLYMIKNDVKIVPTYQINFFEDLMAFELLQVVDQGVLIKKCVNCGRYFIPSGRSDTEYCNRVVAEGTKTCKDVGATKKYKAKVSGDIVNQVFSKAYRRNNSRTRNKKMSQSDFFTWSEQARKLRDDCKTGIISLDEYQQWLNKN